MCVCVRRDWDCLGPAELHEVPLAERGGGEQADVRHGGENHRYATVEALCSLSHRTEGKILWSWTELLLCSDI